MSEWKEYRLGDIADYINRGVTPSYSDEGVIVINQKCVRDGQVKYEQSRYTNSEKKKISEEKYLKSFDILINSTGQGTLGRVGQVKKIISPTTVDSHLTIVRVNKNHDPIFLGYVLKSKQSIIEDLAEGTTGQTELSRYKVAALPLVLPDLPTQTAIAEILSSLDDKIELNNKINQELENLAQILFKQWFIDFEFPNENGEPYKSSGGEMVDSELGEIPKGWVVKNLKEISNCFDNKRIPLSSMERNLRKGEYPYYGAASLMDYVNDFIFDGVYLLMGEDGSVTDKNGIPILQYVFGKFWVNNHAHVLQGKMVSTELIMCLLKNTNVSDLVTGAVQPKLNQANMNKISMAIPTDINGIVLIENSLNHIFEMFRNNINEITELTTIRDTLLPKLISGELEVSQIQTAS